MYYTVIKHDRHLRTRGKCRKHEPQASVFYISRVFSNVRSVLSQCNTRIRLLHLLYDMCYARKTIKHAFSMFYTLINMGFDQSERVQGPISVFSIRFEVCRWLPWNSTRRSNMGSPQEFLSGEFLKVKYTRRLSIEYPPELRQVPGPIESTAFYVIN